MSGNWKCAYAVRQGSGHELENIPCQDAIAVTRTEQVLAMVLCDGAGSYAQSHIAAQIVASSIAEEAAKSFEAWYAMSEVEIADWILQKAHRVCQKEEVYAECTFLLCAIQEDGRRILAHIGDGYLLSAKEEGTTILMDAENGEEPNQTYFLSGKNASAHLFVKKDAQESGEMVLLCSDGTGVSLVNREEETIANAVSKMRDWIQEYAEEDVQEAIGNGLEEFFRKHSPDDLSIGLLYTA